MSTTTQRLRDHLLIALALIALLYLGRSVLIPLAYGLLTAMVLYPFVAGMERRGVNRAVAILIGLVAVTVVFAGIGFLLLWEMHTFLTDLPTLYSKANVDLEVVREWITRTLSLSPADQAGWTADLFGRLPGSLGPLFIKTADAVFGMVFNIFIIPIFTAVLLYDRRALVNAVVAFAGPAMSARMPSILQRSIHRFSGFILGMVKVYAIVGVLNSIGLLLLGVPNAILFGMLTALLTIIPYVGILLSALLPMSVAWITTGNIWSPIGVVAVFGVVQYLEANLIFPKVVGAQLGLNTLASIVIVLLGALLWGVSGMIVLMPFVSIAMILAEDVPGWRPLILLLGRPGKEQAPSGS
ncbi:MAG: AI-2E family transporter [Flavobacteriales bacterium]|nr:AI-2E family transporter [Flavobacteriales bacterium]MBK7555705.1 AI-2E family transporter [Flavobacteriales bacterium]